ncbi:hypothetical protein [Membranihabitans maritimus]|uniref:hypothetical protein n=1 Tax=Membranihabitans maritimus TaxID=2904244 RepID=UPI001F3D4FEA|nr:hypothetical protein [Membranihabitans maritimus]
MAFWFDRFDVRGKMDNIEEENVDIAGVTSRLSDDESGHFPPQTVVKIKCYGDSSTFKEMFVQKIIRISINS